MTDHSPGPWTVEQHVLEDGDLHIAANYDAEQHGSPVLIASVFEDDESVGRKSAEANAKLMARAPELLQENLRLRKILAHVPGRVAIQAKEAAGFATEIKPMADVYSHDSCVFNYCPNPDNCKSLPSGCQHAASQPFDDELAESTRHLPEAPERVETGPTKFGNDWTGLFIRGDDAMRFISAIQAAASLLGEHDVRTNVSSLAPLVELSELLERTDEARL